MRRMVLIGAITALVVVAMLMVGPALIGRAQGTPSAGTSEIQKETLGQGQSAVAPGRTLLLARRTFAAGADSGAHPAPGPVVLFVESGSIDFTVAEGAAIVTRAGATDQEAVAAGGEVTLNAGDAVFYDQGVIHQIVNMGSEPAVTWESRLNPAEPGAEATPATSATASAGGGTTGATAVTIEDFAFDPPSIEVEAGTTVTWTNQDSAVHTVDGDQGEFESGNLEPGNSYSETFDMPGTYTYHCDIHPSMKATIVVR
jgi:plastocyanin